MRPTDVVAGVVWLVVIGVVSCRPIQPPERPASVPFNAIWAGGPDGGSWILCERDPDPIRSTYRCSIFHDFTGELVASGLYEAKGSDIDTIDFDKELAGFDGDVIHLRDHSTLRPIASQQVEK